MIADLESFRSSGNFPPSCSTAALQLSPCAGDMPAALATHRADDVSGLFDQERARFIFKLSEVLYP